MSTRRKNLWIVTAAAAVIALLAVACAADDSAQEAADAAMAEAGSARSEAAAAMSEASGARSDASAGATSADVATAAAAAANATAEAAGAEAAAASAAAEAAQAAADLALATAEGNLELVAAAEAALAEAQSAAEAASAEAALARAEAASAQAEAASAQQEAAAAQQEAAAAQQEAAAAQAEADAALAAAEEATLQAESSAAAIQRGSQTTITMAVNPWNGSAVNVAVAAQLLESEFGYTVETVDIDENAQWAAINTGEIDASLEVWPSGHAGNRADFIDSADGNVDDAGLLGPVGKIGWFMPTYMVDQYPALATWEGLADPELAAMFATAETGDKGQYLGGDPSWTIYDPQIIENLGLNFEIVYVGSETGILAALDAAYNREDPILFYFWTPHSAFNSYDLSNVQLPEYTDECYEQADAGGVDCDYPADDLFKIVNRDLKNNAPAADALLRNMNYAAADQIWMLAAVELDGLSIEEAAAAWIEANASTWQAWLP